MTDDRQFRTMHGEYVRSEIRLRSKPGILPVVEKAVRGRRRFGTRGKNRRKKPGQLSPFSPRSPPRSPPPLHVKAGTAGSANIALHATRETGLVYLACAGGTLNMPCTIDSGNPLNPSVVDFSGGEMQTAKITLTAPTGAKSAGLDWNGIRLAITAHTVSGDQSAVTIPVTIE